jgi:hypothetical protein
MNDNTLVKICFFIIIIGLILFVLFYQNEFEEKTINELIENENSFGIVYGKISHIISKNIFILANETSVKVYSPNTEKIELGSKVKIYAKSQIYNGEIELYAYRVEKQ